MKTKSHVSTSFRPISAVTFGRGSFSGAVFELGLPESRLPPGVPVSEREIAGLLMAGRSIAAIAKARGRSRFTVMNQIQNLYRRLQVRSRAELALLLGTMTQ